MERIRLLLQALGTGGALRNARSELELRSWRDAQAAVAVQRVTRVLAPAAVRPGAALRPVGRVA
jgi:hypothetical protein